MINTDPVDDDCPCPELVFKLENEHQEDQSSLDYHLVLGMLWLYCSLAKSIYYFEKAAGMAPDANIIKSIRVFLNIRLEKETSDV